MADAGRVIAGAAKGVRLVAGGATRPMADRVKQALFGILEPELGGARVLDLFAGSGGGGIEALSRGAAHATFVERDRSALAAIAENLRRAAFEAVATIVSGDVLVSLAPAGRANAEAPYDLVLLDPPYGETAVLVRVLAAVEPLLAPGGRVVAKHFWRDRPPDQVGLLASERERRFGETALTFYRIERQREADERD